MEQSDEDDDSESDMRQQCLSGLTKYQKSKSKIPKNGNYCWKTNRLRVTGYNCE